MSIIIAISGPAGSGKTTYAKKLAKELGLRYVSAGQLFRKMAREKGLSLVEFSRIAEKNYEIDKEIDKRTLEEARKGNVVLDGRLTAWVTKDIAGLKILLTAPLEIRVKRIANRDKKDYNEVFKETVEREQSELKRYKEIYDANPYDLSLYDVVLNTSKFTIDAAVRILKKIVEEYIASHTSIG
ncbi:MAG: (d)CMP kinase [Candidatus Baldrarchaeia archaeon]